MGSRTVLGLVVSTMFWLISSSQGFADDLRMRKGSRYDLMPLEETSAGPSVSSNALMPLEESVPVQAGVPSNDLMPLPSSEPASSITSHPVSRADRVLDIINITALVVSNASLACDGAQTLSMAWSGWGIHHEDNPVLGFRPGPVWVATYFTSTIALNTAIWLLLPKRYRSILPVAVLPVQLTEIRWNMQKASTNSLCGVRL